ncbi:MAG TPA: DUF1499 domain-containing protein [Devosiaceae bacterium]
MRIVIRTSRWAKWAQRFGVLAFPIAIGAVFAHRALLLTSEHFLFVETGAMALGALAVLFGLVAMVRLWFTGDRGWRRAIAGIVLGGVCLSPLAYAAAMSTGAPRIADVSTDLARPPALLSTFRPLSLDTAETDAVATAFPTLKSRDYRLDASTVFELAMRLVRARGWQVRVQRAPLGPDGEGQVNAIAMTLVGWRDEVAIRVSGHMDGTVVDMRSASLFGEADLGTNGRRIEGFLADLDAAVAARLGLPSGDAPAGEGN